MGLGYVILTGAIYSSCQAPGCAMGQISKGVVKGQNWIYFCWGIELSAKLQLWPQMRQLSKCGNLFIQFISLTNPIYLFVFIYLFIVGIQSIKH